MVNLEVVYTHEDETFGCGYMAGGLGACSIPLVDPVSHHCPSMVDGSRKKSGDRLNTF